MLKKIRLLLHYLIYHFLGLIPKLLNVYLIVDGDELGSNTRTFVSFLHGKKEKVFWIKNSPSNNQTDNLPYQIVIPKSLIAKILLIFSRFRIGSAGVDNLSSLTGKNSVYVEFFHGVPIKKIAKDNRTSYDLELYSSDNLWHKLSYFKHRINKPRYYIVNSNEEAVLIGNAHDLRPENIQVLGSPRIDELFKNIELINKEINFFHKEIKNLIETVRTFIDSKKSVILILPTWSESKSEFLSEQWLIRNTESSLIKNDTLFIYKKHPFENDLVGVKYLSDTFVSLGKDVDVYPFLKYVSILISDFSSVILDFAVLQRPIIILKKHGSSKRKLYSFSEVIERECELISNEDNLIEKINDLLATEKVCKYSFISIMGEQVGDNCARIYNFLNK